MVELRESTLEVSVGKKEKHIRGKGKVESKHSVHEHIEQGILTLEERMTELDQKLWEAEDVELLQQLYKEKEDLEKEWEKLYDQLEDA
ncbi:hypothetical protein [Pontibacillus litoralis]|uniref:Uncharacterized protein n=1 Tax=Pontibacillus litoralis JSM 072002 TaxID=1385512 RepID=A0A0A5HSM8_9BACI|nr:hypothetical protein [Pontibacillus litoralis]KGX86647.1 hypothetical protein N784_04510 [Pontibacillus litoralis JSM 072002]